MSRGAVPFYFVDVFAVTPLTGNPVAVVPDADGLSDAQMQAIAREFNQSETAFVLAPQRPGATVRLRSFTPIGAEVFGAAHNALGCWLWLALAGRLPAAGAASPLAQQIGDDVLPVRVRRPPGGAVVVSMHQSPPQFGSIAADDAAAYARFFNPTMGIAEDPATGTAAGPLAALLVHRGQLDAGPAVIEQGRALGRPSRIQVQVSGPSVTVSGSGLISAEGVLHL
jgi:predicted PhzF superfamily epimerase YddE/YHI9